MRQLGEEDIETYVVPMDDRDARMWEIGENLHRAELTVQQRSDQLSEYAQLAREKRGEAKLAQVAPVSGGRGHEGGDRAVARDLKEEFGVSRRDIERARKIASIDPEAKLAAQDAGIDNNQSALLKVASHADEDQVAAVAAIAAEKAKAKSKPVSPIAPRIQADGSDKKNLISMIRAAVTAAGEGFEETDEEDEDYRQAREQARQHYAEGIQLTLALSDDELESKFEMFIGDLVQSNIPRRRRPRTAVWA
jgi:ParB family chromosome partitioning protein